MSSFNLPDFDSRERKLEPIEFIPVSHVFTAMVEIRCLVDISGWAGNRNDRKKWSMTAGSVHIIDNAKAREFVAKGYAEFTRDPDKPLTEDEIAEARSQVTTIRMGGRK